MTIKGRTGRRALAAAIGIAALVGSTASTASVIEEDPQQRWVARYNQLGNAAVNIDAAYSLAVSPDGATVFVTGGGWDLASGGGWSAGWATVAYATASGDELWATLYSSGDLVTGEAGASMAVSPDGSRVFVTGQSYGPDGSFDYATVAYAASDGAQLWASRYNGPGNGEDRAHSITVSPDGSRVFVTGQSAGLDSYLDRYPLDYATVAYGASTGAQLWVARGRYSSVDDHARAIAVSPDGSTVFVTGDVDRPYALTVAYAASSGAELWTAIYGHATYSWTRSIAVSPDGSTVFVTGNSYSPDNGRYINYATVAYAASSGAELWVMEYNGAGDAEDYASSLSVSPDGSTVFVTGRSRKGPYSGDSYVTVAYATSSGAQLWAGGDESGVPSSIAVSPDGSTVFVTGGGDRYATVAYAASSGAELWTLRYDGPVDSSYESANSLAVSPDGSTVFVTGQSYDSRTSMDYTTVAYRTTTCASGDNEIGPVSGPLHDEVEPGSGPAHALVHGASCDVVAANGL